MALLQALRSGILVAMLVWHVQAATMDVFMDSPTACGKTYYAGEREVFRVKPRGSVGVSNPPTSCPVYFESSHASSNYKFEIVVEAAAFRDCGLSLRIFDGKSTGSNYIRMLGCGSTTSTGHFYSKDQAMALMLTRTQNQYFFGSDFQLRIQLYYDTKGADEYFGTIKFPAGAIIDDTNGADEYTGTTKFPAGAIIGIILGVIVFIAAAILLGWCYKTGRLPGLSPCDYPPSTVKANSENLSEIELNPQGQYQHPQGNPQYRQGQPSYPRGQPNYPQSQPSYPQGQPNYPQGHPSYPQGQPNYPQGQPNYPQGQPSYTQGQPNYPQGQPSYPQGQPNYPQGQLNYPQGQPNYPQGQPNYPQGQPSFPQGQPNYPQGQLNYPQGQPSYPQGQPNYSSQGQYPPAPQSNHSHQNSYHQANFTVPLQQAGCSPRVPVHCSDQATVP